MGSAFRINTSYILQQYFFFVWRPLRLNLSLSQLLLKKHSPSAHRNFLTNHDQNDADVSILGFLLADQRLKYRKPDVKINGIAIDASYIGALDQNK
jgi:hypothetical protein